MVDQKAKYLVVIAGPTGVGKTSLSIQLAQHYNTEILNADSRQIYQELTIGTAKPTSSELASVRHHFINHVSIQDHYTASDYENQAIELLHELFNTRNIVILSGGSGLYIQAVLEGFDAIPEVEGHVQEQLNEELSSKGLISLQNELKRVDPDYHASVDLQNPRRIIRALSVFRAHNQPFSSYLTKGQKSREFTPILLFLNRDRDELYTRINQRVDQMMIDGLLDEVKSLAEFKHLKSLQTVGYQELFGYLDGLRSQEDAVELIKRNSRRYAKRQLTWYRNRPNWQSFHPDEILKISKYIREI